MSLRQRVEHLNNFLDDLYKEETRLSKILTRGGLEAQDILMLRENHLDAMISCVESILMQQLLELNDGDRICQVIFRRYALGKSSIETLQQIGDGYGISRERVRQLQSKALRQLRHPRKKARLETELIESANVLLGRTNAES